MAASINFSFKSTLNLLYDNFTTLKVIFNWTLLRRPFFPLRQPPLHPKTNPSEKITVVLWLIKIGIFLPPAYACFLFTLLFFLSDSYFLIKILSTSFVIFRQLYYSSISHDFFFFFYISTLLRVQ